MKNLNVISILLGALIGVAATILITKYFFPEKNYSAFPGQEIKFEEIDSAKAKDIADNYQKTINNPKDSCDYKKAINVSKEQYELIKRKVSSMTTQGLDTISGFRLYFSYSPDNSLVSTIFSINNNFNEVPADGYILISNKYNKIYALECPPFCNGPLPNPLD